MSAQPTGSITLRHAGTEDAGTLALVGAATFLEAYAGSLDGRSLLTFCGEHHTRAAWSGLLSVSSNHAWLAEITPGAAPIGYAALLAAPEMPAEVVRAGDMELKRIYVFSRFYGSGVAQRLMQAVFAQARAAEGRRLLVGLHRGNLRAMAFYLRHGFVEVGVRRFTVGNCCFEDPVLALNLEATVS